MIKHYFVPSVYKILTISLNRKAFLTKQRTDIEFAIKPRENGNSYSEGDIKMHGNKFGVAFGRALGVQ